MSDPGERSGRVLVVDDDASLARVLAATLRQEGFVPRTVPGAAEALAAIDDGGFDVVLTDLRMPGTDGLGLLAQVAARWPTLPVVVMTAHGSIPVAVEAMRAGAADFVTKPFEREEIAFVLRKAIARADADEVDAASSAGASPATSLLLGESPALRAARGLLERAARSDATVLLRGESGTGKDVAARALHQASARSGGPFVKVHCGALPEALLESELFGHEKGAFTGAVARKPGRAELAHGGTLFLDEIGDVSLGVQVKLLELLQDRAFFRVGGASRVEVDVRIVAATHRDLEAMVARGELREDLYYRLAVVPIVMPPLRERAGDVERLAHELARRIGTTAGRPGVRLLPDAIARLVSEPWPGNVRQLANVLERLVVLGDEDAITAVDVERELARLPRPPGAPAATAAMPTGATVTATGPVLGAAPAGGPAGPGGPLVARRDEAERVAIDDALSRAHGNKTLAARLLGISRRTLYNKLETRSG